MPKGTRYGFDKQTIEGQWTSKLDQSPIMETLRQLCIYKKEGDDQFIKYLGKFEETCFSGDTLTRNIKDCSDKIITELNTNARDNVDHCVTSIVKDGVLDSNSELFGWVIDNLKDIEQFVTILPSIKINSVILRVDKS